jgi:hypothetical protein
MGVHWYDHTMPVTDYGSPPAPGTYQTTIGTATLTEATAADGTTSLNVSGDPNQIPAGGLVRMRPVVVAKNPNPNPVPDPWQPGAGYTAGQRVTYDGQTYQCLQGHTAYADSWTPQAAPALWQPTG